ncbi:MAG: hypothetical protein JST68_27080 [Bacteroidetes bacterium]|nr:hypothetical protein [Bacteroidota bacterium]
MNPFYALLSLVLVLPKSQQWEKQQDRINGKIPRASLEKMKTTTESLAGFLQDSALFIDGYNPVWHGEYSADKSSAMNRFGLSCSFYDSSDASHNAADLLIMANDMSPMLQSIQANGRGYMTLHPASSTTADVPYFELTPEGSTTRLKFWLVTSDNGNLPYTPLTQKDYLQETRTSFLAEKNRIIENIKAQLPIRSLAVQEAEKKATIDQLNNTYSGTDREFRMRQFLRNYQTDEEYQKDKIKKETTDFDDAITNLDSLLRQPAAELTKPATLPDGSMLVQPNASFVNPGLGNEKAQFFLVCWRYNPEDPKAVALDQQFTQQFKSSQLRDFLGK